MCQLRGDFGREPMRKEVVAMMQVARHIEVGRGRVAQDVRQFACIVGTVGAIHHEIAHGACEAQHKERGDVPHDAIETLPTPPLLPLLVRRANAPLLWLVVLQVAIHRADFTLAQGTWTRGHLCV